MSIAGGTWEHRGLWVAQEGLRPRTVLALKPFSFGLLGLQVKPGKIRKGKTETLLIASVQLLSPHHLSAQLRDQDIQLAPFHSLPILTEALLWLWSWFLFFSFVL